MESTLLIADQGAVRTITLNRPERRNAMTPEMQSELIDAMQDAARSSCRVLVFQGAGERVLLRASISPPCSRWPANPRTNIAPMPNALAEALPHSLRAANAHHRRGAWRSNRRWNRPGDHLRLHARCAVGEVWLHRGPHRFCACPRLRVSCACRSATSARATCCSPAVFFDAAEAHRLGLVNEVRRAGSPQCPRAIACSRASANSPQSLAATKRLLAAQNKALARRRYRSAPCTPMHAPARPQTFTKASAAFLEKRKPVWSTKR